MTTTTITTITTSTTTTTTFSLSQIVSFILFSNLPSRSFTLANRSPPPPPPPPGSRSIFVRYFTILSPSFFTSLIAVISLPLITLEVTLQHR